MMGIRTPIVAVLAAEVPMPGCVRSREHDRQARRARALRRGALHARRSTPGSAPCSRSRRESGTRDRRGRRFASNSLIVADGSSGRAADAVDRVGRETRSARPGARRRPRPRWRSCRLSRRHDAVAPARSCSRRTSANPAATAAARITWPCVSPISTASTPPDRSATAAWAKRRSYSSIFPTSAVTGSARTSAGNVSSSSARTYGGLLTTRSTAPRSDDSTGSSRSPSTTSTFRAKRPAFVRASETACSETSVANTVASGRSSLDRERDAPVPVPTSRTTGAETPSIEPRARARRVPRSPAAG